MSEGGVMRIKQYFATATTVLLVAVGVAGLGGGPSAQAYGGDGHMAVYQIGISFNCNNKDFCGSDNLGGFWGWAELDHNPTTGANTGDAEFAGCSHGTFKGAGHISQDISDWYVASGSAGPRTFFVTGVETDKFAGQTFVQPFKDQDTGVPAVAGHYSTSEIFGFSPPPGVAAQIQVAYKPAH
jgi:hypothetical protein